MACLGQGCSNAARTSLCAFTAALLWSRGQFTRGNMSEWPTPWGGQAPKKRKNLLPQPLDWRGKPCNQWEGWRWDAMIGGLAGSRPWMKPKLPKKDPGGGNLRLTIKESPALWRKPPPHPHVFKRPTRQQNTSNPLANSMEHKSPGSSVWTQHIKSAVWGKTLKKGAYLQNPPPLMVGHDPTIITYPTKWTISQKNKTRNH